MDPVKPNCAYLPTSRNQLERTPFAESLMVVTHVVVEAAQLVAAAAVAGADFVEAREGVVVSPALRD